MSKILITGATIVLLKSIKTVFINAKRLLCFETKNLS